MSIEGMKGVGKKTVGVFVQVKPPQDTARDPSIHRLDRRAYQMKLAVPLRPSFAGDINLSMSQERPRFSLMHR